LYDVARVFLKGATVRSALVMEELKFAFPKTLCVLSLGVAPQRSIEVDRAAMRRLHSAGRRWRFSCAAADRRDGRRCTAQALRVVKAWPKTISGPSDIVSDICPVIVGMCTQKKRCISLSKVLIVMYDI
jgi:hypothetical protein